MWSYAPRFTFEALCQIQPEGQCDGCLLSLCRSLKTWSNLGRILVSWKANGLWRLSQCGRSEFPADSSGLCDLIFGGYTCYTWCKAQLGNLYIIIIIQENLNTRSLSLLELGLRRVWLVLIKHFDQWVCSWISWFCLAHSHRHETID